jgi:hypothetical protein
MPCGTHPTTTQSPECYSIPLLPILVLYMWGQQHKASQEVPHVRGFYESMGCALFFVSSPCAAVKQGNKLPRQAS